MSEREIIICRDAVELNRNWGRVHLFWGDERCVPPDHPESNYRMVHESLLSKIHLPAENIHRMAGEKEPRVAGTSTKRSYAASLL